MSKNAELLLSSITQYYDKHPGNKALLEPIVHGEFDVSLRVLDWFITHYAKEKNVVYWIDPSTLALYHAPAANLKKVHVYLDYRAQLKSYSKFFFDPFRRHERISFVLQGRPLKSIETTIGQLNFFRWVFQNNVLGYVRAHKAVIEEHISKHQKALDKQTVTVRTMTPLSQQTRSFLRFD
jgi:hypothetical protein